MILFFVIKGAIAVLKNRKIATDKDGNVKAVTVSSIIQKDSNNNGIEDWEEYLWGLDPQKNGPENKEFILAKKKSLEESGQINTSDREGEPEEVSQNAMLARQLFATIISLQGSGDLNDETIASLTESIGQEVKATEIPDTYTKNMLTIVDDSYETRTNYINAFEEIYNKYQDEDMGEELIIIAQGIINNDQQALSSIKSIAIAYQNMGKDLLKIPVPTSLAETYLSLINNCEKVAQSIEGLTGLVNNTMDGMSYILNYKKYSDALISDLENITEFLQ